MPTRFLINQCQISTFLILKFDNIDVDLSRLELKGIVLPVPSNQIKVIFIIILPFNGTFVIFFLFHNLYSSRLIRLHILLYERLVETLVYLMALFKQYYWKTICHITNNDRVSNVFCF